MSSNDHPPLLPPFLPQASTHTLLDTPRPTTMATSDVVLPLEILEELVVRDLSPASLAVWCRVGSRALLTFAGRHLYEEVTLTRGDDVVPFLRRLVSRLIHLAVRH